MLPAFFLLAQACFAQAPVGQVRFVYRDLGVPVWDVTGGYVFHQEVEAEGRMLPVVMGFEVNQDINGKLTGQGVTTVSLGTEVVGGEYTASGRVYNSKDGTQVSITVRASGMGMVAGVQTDFSIKVNYKLVVNPATGRLEGTAKGSLKYNKIGSGKINSQVSAPLVEGMNGGWEIAMEVLPLGKISGSGNVTLSNNRILAGNAKGGYSEKTGLSKVTLTGTGDAKGYSFKLQFTTAGTVDTLQQLKGKILGQKIQID